MDLNIVVNGNVTKNMVLVFAKVEIKSFTKVNSGKAKKLLVIIMKK